MRSGLHSRLPCGRSRRGIERHYDKYGTVNPGYSTSLRYLLTLAPESRFPGVHSNVGGGYDDQQLANITLAWMMSQLKPFLDMRDDYLFEQDDENDKYYRKDRQEIRPWSFGEIYNSMTGLYALGGGTVSFPISHPPSSNTYAHLELQFRTPGLYHAVDPYTGRTTDRPLRLTNEYIHPSVRARIRLNGPGVSDKGAYECRALTDNYKLVVDYGTQTTKSGDPDIFWKLKFKDDTAVRILPEAPLWQLERELCRKDPHTYDYVKKPPATGSSSKRRKSQRPVSADFGNGRVGGSRAGAGRRSFADDERDGRRSFVEVTEKRSKSRARSLDRESEYRDTMPHRRPKDRTWWEGGSQAAGARSPRRSSMRV